MCDKSRFEDKYVPEPNSGCWLWVGAVSGSGYGAFAFEGKGAFLAHRASWVLHKGSIPDGKIVCHKCDVPLCVNPDHLFIGTHKENSEDMIRKGRAVLPSKENRLRGRDWYIAHIDALPRGEDHSQSVLTRNDVIKIRKSSDSCAALAKLYGVSNVTISRVKRRKNWRSVP